MLATELQISWKGFLEKTIGFLVFGEKFWDARENARKGLKF